ncbi:MAG TPA: YceI family protein [Thermoanaerobaculia bacterium]|jgi:polyisoprenoid-binding protein YceI|nr:YceI family protein [Thermoanaerobaculia bacterium]
MLRKLRMLALFLATATAAAPLLAVDTYTVDKVHSDVTFQVRHFVSKVRGNFTDFSGTIQVDPAKPEASSVAFTIKTASISTNNEGRDKHLNSPDFFDTAKFPEITFQSTKIASAGKDKYAVTGTLTMHGVSKEITLPVAFLGTVKDPKAGERAGFELNTKLDRKDYGILYNRVLEGGGTMLSDDVDVTISLETVKKGPEAPAATK